MKEVWNEKKKFYERGVKNIQALISKNVDEIDECVIEYLDEAINEEELITSLRELRSERNKLFDVRDILESKIRTLNSFIEKYEKEIR